MRKTFCCPSKTLQDKEAIHSLKIQLPVHEEQQS